MYANTRTEPHAILPDIIDHSIARTNEVGLVVARRELVGNVTILLPSGVSGFSYKCLGLEITLADLNSSTTWIKF